MRPIRAGDLGVRYDSSMAETITLFSNLGPQFTLGPETIRRLDNGVEEVLAFDNIVRVRAMTLGGGGVVELTAGDGRKMLVVSSRETGRGSPRLKEPARGDYRNFAAELHRRLAACGHPIQFVGGMIFKKPYDPLAIPDKLLP